VSPSAAEVVRYLAEIGQLRECVTTRDDAGEGAVLERVTPDAVAGPGDLSWSRHAEAAAGFRGALLVGPAPAPAAAALAAGATVAACANPRLAMASVIGRFFAHLTADQDPVYAEQALALSVSANQAWVMNARIGRDVCIGPHATIGCSGMGYERDAAGRLVKFPQLGGVLIEDDVDVAAHATIQRGALGDTVLRRGTRIGPHVNVGHNVVVGEDVLLAGHAQVGGGACIGRAATIWQGAVIANGVTIGEGAVIGMSAAVRRDVNPGEVWAGNPARKLR
jgi:UDP-3-O-[3-hydroxymyristoyl] glucosamine N-acyltransferase LpxD